MARNTHCENASGHCKDWTCCPPPGYSQPKPARRDAPSGTSYNGGGGGGGEAVVWLIAILLGASIAILPAWIIVGYPYMAVRSVIEYNPFLITLAFLGLTAGAVITFWNRYVAVRALSGAFAVCALVTLTTPMNPPTTPQGVGFGEGGVALLVSVGSTLWVAGLIWYTRRRKNRDFTYSPNAPRTWTPWRALRRPAATIHAPKPMLRPATVPSATNHLSPHWHPDPTGRYTHRYWNGTMWTRDAADNGVPVDDPIT